MRKGVALIRSLVNARSLGFAYARVLDKCLFGPISMNRSEAGEIENGRRVTNFFAERELCMFNTYFMQKYIHR